VSGERARVVVLGRFAEDEVGAAEVERVDGGGALSRAPRARWALDCGGAEVGMVASWVSVTPTGGSATTATIHD